MKKKYKNRLPKGAQVQGYIAHVSDGEIIVEVELKNKFLPKDGDFLIDADGDIFICSNAYTQNSNFYSCYYGNFYSCYCGTHHGKIRAAFCHNWVDKEGCRFATPEEKADFLKRLETEERLRWNADTKKLEPIRWRAQGGEIYYYVNSWGEIVACKDCYTGVDKYRHEIGNYFLTEDAAKPYAEKMKELFKNSKQDDYEKEINKKDNG